MSDGTEQRQAIEEELSQWRAVGRALWPYVRFFGLCGAAPEAVEVVGYLGRLLGEGTISNDAIASAAATGRAEGRQQAARDIVQQLRAHGLVHKTGPRLFDDIKRVIEQAGGGSVDEHSGVVG